MRPVRELFSKAMNPDICMYYVRRTGIQGLGLKAMKIRNDSNSSAVNVYELQKVFHSSNGHEFRFLWLNPVRLYSLYKILCPKRRI